MYFLSCEEIKTFIFIIIIIIELSSNYYFIFHTNVFLLCFVYIVIIKTQNSTLACVSSEQPGPGATLLGWPKSIYYLVPGRRIIA